MGEGEADAVIGPAASPSWWRPRRLAADGVDGGLGILVGGVLGVPLLQGLDDVRGVVDHLDRAAPCAPAPALREEYGPSVPRYVSSDQESLAKLGLKRMWSTPIVMASLTVGGRRC